MEIDLIIFDLDGTLVASLEGIQYSMNQVLEKYGYPTHGLDEYRLFVGYGLKKVAERALPEERRSQEHIDMIYKELLESYSAGYTYKLRLYPDMAETLDGIVQRNIRLAVNTNKHEHIAKEVVDSYMDQWPVLQVAGSLKDRPRKPDPAGVQYIMEALDADPKRTLYIGDTSVDLETARNAGIECVGVTYGFRTKEELMAHNPQYLIDSPLELLELLDKPSS